MKILILGSSGTLGAAIYSKLKKKYITKHNGILKRKYDLSKISKLKMLIKISKPDLIINCAAIVDINYCEKFKIKSKKINLTLVEQLFRIKKKNHLNFQLIQFSTDHVYDCKKNLENAETSKIFINNEYTRQKYLAEKICLKNQALIFRTNFFGKNTRKKGFSDWLFKTFSSKKISTIYLFKDVYFSPLRIDSIAKIMEKLIFEKNNLLKFGIYNLCSKNGISKKNFALAFIRKCKIDMSNKKIIFKNVNDFLNVKRSKNMRMCYKKFQTTFNIKPKYLSAEIINEAKKYV